MSVSPSLSNRSCSEIGFEDEQRSEAVMSSPSAAASTSNSSDRSENGDPRSRLEQLKSHPFFGDLQVTLALDCLNSTVPYSLLSESNHSSSKPKQHPSFCTVSDSVMEQHVNLQKTLVGVQMYFPSVLGMYHQLVDEVESQRYKALTYNCHSENVKRLINWFYDCERRTLMEKIQESIGAMNKATDLLPVAPTLNFGLRNNIFGFPVGNGKPINITASASVESEIPLDLSGSPNKLYVKSSMVEKKSRFLSKKAVSTLQNWYQNHRDHPYATDDEVRELAAAGSITPNQVKKWMANTRARSFNTLTYNGGKHMLNSKIAMKKRLLHKYKIEPPKTSGSGLFNVNQASQQKTLPTVKHYQAEEKCEDDETIDIETVSSSQGADVNDEDSNSTCMPIDTDNFYENTQTALYQQPAGKVSLEQVIARCRQKTSESSKEVDANLKNNKSVIESLKDVVNNVSPTKSHTSTDSELSPTNESSLGAHSPQSFKRYLSPQAKTILSEWFRKHLYRPYPTFEEKRELAALCGISSSKVDTWFANKRNRTNNTKKFSPKYSHIL
ncbi:uncharacterized protein [Watersipora subatra]|uniref:uncharacterized protein n=1 Tax=Watersipora subatra TaxID=2589382 RepID=UPI00355C04F5